MIKNGVRFGRAVALIMGLLLVGCVSTEVVPDGQPRLGVAQNGDGTVVFALETTVGYQYTILYEDPKLRSWRPVQGCEDIPGTGETIEIEKKFNSRGPLPPFTVDYAKIIEK